MNKRSLFEKRYVIRILALILGGNNTNKKIANIIKRDPSTISEQIDYLQNRGIVYLLNKKGKKYNEKEYGVECEKIAELFFEYYVSKKQLIRFKNNELIPITFAMLIFSKKNHKEIEKITLLDIFEEAYKLFLHRAILLKKGKDHLEGFTIHQNKQKTKSEFKRFLTQFYRNYEEVLTELNKDIQKAYKTKQ